MNKARDWKARTVLPVLGREFWCSSCSVRGLFCIETSLPPSAYPSDQLHRGQNWCWAWSFFSLGPILSFTCARDPQQVDFWLRNMYFSILSGACTSLLFRKAFIETRELIPACRWVNCRLLTMGLSSSNFWKSNFSEDLYKGRRTHCFFHNEIYF